MNRSIMTSAIAAAALAVSSPAHAVARNNRSHGNGSDGFYVNGFGLRLERNHANGNERFGISASARERSVATPPSGTNAPI